MQRLSRAVAFFKEHPRAFLATQLVLLAIFFGFAGWAIRGSLQDASDDLRNANPYLFALGCAALAAYYLLFVLGWMRILADWNLHISYPAALRAEIHSLKGSSCQVGAHSMSSLCAEIEVAIGHVAASRIMELVDRLELHCAAAVSAMRECSEA